MDGVAVAWALGAFVLGLVAFRKFTRNKTEWTSKSKLYNERGVPYVSVTTTGFWPLIRGIQSFLAIDEHVRRFGKVFGFDEGNSPTILVSEPEILQQVLSKDFTNFVNRRVSDQSTFTSKMLFLAEDENWKRLRSIVAPTFSAGKMKLMKPLIDETILNLLRNFDKSIQENNKVVDIKHLAGAYTLDTIIKTAFGVNIDSTNEVDNPFVENARKIFVNEFSWRVVFFTVLQRYARPLNTAITKINQFFTGKVGTGIFLETAAKIIEEKKKDFAKRKAEGTVKKASDFIELMLEAEAAGELSLGDGSSGKASKFITREEMLAQCLIFFLGGYDTTATTITMTCYNLATHPEMQDQLYTEINEVMAKLSSEMNTEDPFDLVTLDTLSRFEYLNAVVNETLRIHPPVPSIERRAAADIKLETSDGRICIDLKKGDVIHIPIWSIHRDPDNYEEPNAFQPDRFIGEPKHHRYAHIPFGSGPRTCVARSLGLLEAKMAVLYLVRRFRMSVCDQTAIPLTFYSPNNLLSPKGVVLKCESR